MDNTIKDNSFLLKNSEKRWSVSGWILPGILLICLLMRLLWIFQIAPAIPGVLGRTSGHPELAVPSDFFYHYHPVAKNILTGRGFLDREGKVTAHLPPLYPLFLSLIYRLFGKSPSTLRLIQIFIDTISCFLTIKIANSLFGRKIALLTGGLYACFPLLLYQSGILLSETLFTFIVLSAVYFLVKTFTRPNYCYAFFSGLLIGLSVLCKEVPLLLPLFILGGLLYKYRIEKKEAYKNFSLIIIAMCLVIGPWVIRNYIVFNDFILFRTSPSYVRDFAEVGKDSQPQPALQTWIAKKQNAILSNPAEYIKKTAIAFFMMWYATDSGDWQRELMLLQFGTVILAIGGILLCRKLKTNDLPLLLVILYWVLIIPLVSGRGLVRYVIPIMPLILIYVSSGVLWCFEKIQLAIKCR
ncbi:MAG: glycosyltransferase family 39 protein [Candidatus Omnitrophota bacterium]